MKLRLLVLFVVIAPTEAAIASDADTIWFGGTIITVNDEVPNVEAVAIKDGRITAVGSKDAVFQAEQGKATVLRT